MTVPRWVPAASMGLSFFAVGVTTYLTVAHYSDPGLLACPNTGVINCALVTTSTWSVLFGIPVAVLGLCWAVGMTVLSLPLAWRAPSPWVDRVRLAASVAGGGMVLYLVYVELFRIGAICLWCTSVHISAIALLAVTLTARASITQQAGSSGPPASSTTPGPRTASSSGAAGGSGSESRPH